MITIKCNRTKPDGQSRIKPISNEDYENTNYQETKITYFDAIHELVERKISLLKQAFQFAHQ